VDIFK